MLWSERERPGSATTQSRLRPSRLAVLRLQPVLRQLVGSGRPDQPDRQVGDVVNQAIALLGRALELVRVAALDPPPLDRCLDGCQKDRSCRSFRPLDGFAEAVGPDHLIHGHFHAAGRSVPSTMPRP